MTPSLPTFSMTSAIRVPISGSAAEIVATWAISSLPLTGVALAWMSAMSASEARSIPRLSSMALAPAATLRMPSCTIAWARTVAVVVPSPATSFVLVAASFRSCAPILANGSSSSISLATVTPSWVTVGAPYFLSSATLRPLGPRVVLTALARMSTPSLRDFLAVSLNSSIFGIELHSVRYKVQVASVTLPLPREKNGVSLETCWLLLGNDRQDVLLGEDEQLLVVELELGAGVLGEEHLVADAHVEGDAVAVVVAAAVAGGDDGAAL